MGHQIWGGAAPRRFFTDKHWKDPIDWNEDAQRRQTRERVFCASMADVFERRVELNSQRERLWKLIEETPWLDWLLLTKRPQNIEGMVPWTNDWPVNVWLGTTVENQRYADERLPHLLKHAASVRFLSCEPLLGPVDLRPWMNRKGMHPISWVIAGGESGGNARPMHPEWPTGILDQCREHGVPFHFKQWGNWVPTATLAGQHTGTLVDFAGARAVQMSRLPKKEAGRILEGTTWDGVPTVAPQNVSRTLRRTRAGVREAQAS